MIQGKKVTLEVARLSDRKHIYEMGLSTAYMKDCFKQSYLEGFKSFEEDYTECYFDNKDSLFCGGLLICVDANPVGFISYGQPGDEKNVTGVMELDIWMDGEKNCAKGLGVDAITTLMNYLQKEYKTHTFLMCPEKSNFRAIRAYEKAGFVEIKHPEKQEIMNEIFTQSFLESLEPDHEYASNETAFMLKK